MTMPTGSGESSLGCWRVELGAPAGLAPRRHPNDLLLAALYDAIAAHPGIDPALKDRVHHEQPKSFTLSPLFVQGADGVDRPVAALGGAHPGARLWFRWSALDPAARAIALAVLDRLRQGPPLTLQGAALPLAGWSVLRPPGGPELDSYAALFARTEPATTITLRFPWSFAIRSSGRIVPPEQLAPRHFFGGYRQRWAAVSPSEMAAFPAERLLAAVHLLPPRELIPALRPALPSKGATAAYAGRLSFTVDGDEPTRQAVAALADYAWYCGTGSATAWGLGQTERA